MSTFEIVSSDEDVASTIIDAYDGEAFLTQTTVDGKNSCVLLNTEMAKQVMAVLSSFVAGKTTHSSDCALHSAPAYPLTACTCTHTTTKG